MKIINNYILTVFLRSLDLIKFRFHQLNVTSTMYINQHLLLNFNFNHKKHNKANNVAFCILTLLKCRFDSIVLNFSINILAIRLMN